MDPGLPGWLDLRERLLPTHASLGIDRPAPAPDGAAAPVAPAVAIGGRAAVLAYELGPDMAWPPDGLPAGVADLGRCDSREDRARIRALLGAPPAHLLFVCDARLTPDRGAAAWLDELRRSCPDLRALCLGGSPQRLQAWQDILSRQAVSRIPSLNGWLEHIGSLRHD